MGSTLGQWRMQQVWSFSSHASPPPAVCPPRWDGLLASHGVAFTGPSPPDLPFPSPTHSFLILPAPLHPRHCLFSLSKPSACFIPGENLSMSLGRGEGQSLWVQTLWHLRVGAQQQWSLPQAAIPRVQ